MGDTFWMEYKLRTEWEEEEFIFQQARYSLTDTGSQYLDPAWRQNIARVKSEPTKIQALISLN